MFGLIGKIRAVAGQRDALATILQKGTTQMAGCQSYVLAHDPADADVLWITEVWNSAEDHRASLSLPSVQQAITNGRPLIASFEQHTQTIPLSGWNAFANSTTIAPMLSVRNGAKAVDFYKAAFGAAERYRIDAPDGAVVAKLAVADAEFWLSDESPEYGNFSPATLGGGTTRMILTVPDPDALFAQAIAAGAKEISAIEEAHGWRVGRVVDPFDHHWEIGHPLSE